MQENVYHFYSKTFGNFTLHLPTSVSFVPVVLGGDVNLQVLLRLDEVGHLRQSFLFCNHKKSSSFLFPGPFWMKLQPCLRPTAIGAA